MTEARSKRLVLPLGFIVKWAKFISGEWAFIIDVFGFGMNLQQLTLTFSLLSSNEIILKEINYLCRSYSREKRHLKRKLEEQN